MGFSRGTLHYLKKNARDGKVTSQIFCNLSEPCLLA